MSTKKCCVPGCMDSEKSERRKHSFPNPIKDRERFYQWVFVIGSELIGLDNDFIHKYCRVCHAHFEEKFHCRFDRLSNIAVPTLNLPGSLTFPKLSFYESRPMRPICNRPRTTPPIKESLAVPSTSMHIADECRSQSPVIFEKEAKLHSNATSATPGHELQIKTKEQKVEIDSNIYIPEVVDEISPESDSDLMQIEPSKTNVEEQDVQRDVIVCFEHVSTTGLSEHDRKDLADKHLVSGNCMLFGAPALNPEVKVALSQMAIERDQAIEHKQALLASAIAGLVEAIAVVVSSEDNKANLLRLLVDTGRLLCECQYNDTMTRRNCILNAVNKDMKEKLKNTKIDTYLFGEWISIPHNLKTAESTSKSGAQLTMEPGPNTSQTIHKSVAPVTMRPSSIRVEEIHKPGGDISLVSRLKTVKSIHKSTPTLKLKPVKLIDTSGAKIIQTQTNTAEAIHKSGGDISLVSRLKTIKAIYKSFPTLKLKPVKLIRKSDAKIIQTQTPNTAEAIHKSGGDISLISSPKTAKVIHKSSAIHKPGSDNTKSSQKLLIQIPNTPSQKSAELIHKSGAEISLTHGQTVDVIQKSGSDITMTPTQHTAEAIHNSGTDIILAPTLKIVEAIHDSSTELTMAPEPKSVEAIHKPSAEITLAPRLKIAEGDRKSGAEICLAPKLKTVKAIHYSGTETTMAPKHNQINMPKKRKYSDSCDYEKKEVIVIEHDERLKLDSPKWSPS